MPSIRWAIKNKLNGIFTDFVLYCFVCTFSVLLGLCLHILVSVFAGCFLSFFFFFGERKVMELGRWRGGGAGGREKHVQNLLHEKNFFQLKKERRKKEKQQI